MNSFSFGLVITLSLVIAVWILLRTTYSNKKNNAHLSTNLPVPASPVPPGRRGTSSNFAMASIYGLENTFNSPRLTSMSSYRSSVPFFCSIGFLVSILNAQFPSLFFGSSFCVFRGLFSLVLPLVALAYSLKVTRFLGPNGLALLFSLSLFLSFLFSSVSFYFFLGGNDFFFINGGSWFGCSFFEVTWSLLFDPFSLPMIRMVSLISCLVHLYSFSYMSGDHNLASFLTYLFFFTVSMLLLVSRGNLVLFFRAWEFIGLRSFFLIGFWTTRPRAVSSALKAVFVNRLGDFFLLLLIASTLFSFGTTEFYLLPVLVDHSEEKFLFLAVLAAGAKSAQLGFHVWLPDAMEGPTPVSALIHAATLVTAGVFLLTRLSFLLPCAPTVAFFACTWGACTAFFRSMVALVQNDLKKVIAYSTASQLGLMFYAWGSLNPALSFFHLLAHAFFKACLFLSAGCVIHAFHGEQDMRRMGGCAVSLPLTLSAMVCSSLALVGFPFTSGFFSKDPILESGFGSSYSGFLQFLVLLATALTAAYSSKLIYLTFFNNREVPSFPKANLLESDIFMSTSIFVLSFFSLFFGYFFNPVFSQVANIAWGTVLSLPSYGPPSDFSFLPFFLKEAPFFLTVLGAVLGVFFHRTTFTFLGLYRKFPSVPFFSFLISSKFAFDHLLSFFIRSFFYPLSKAFLDTIDRGLLELLFIRFPFSLGNWVYSAVSKTLGSGFLGIQVPSIVFPLFFVFHFQNTVPLDGYCIFFVFTIVLFSVSIWPKKFKNKNPLNHAERL